MTIALMVGNGTVRMGMQGAVVQAIQARLKTFGAPLLGTGYYGPATDTAVESFQRLHGLNVSGIVDKATAVALDIGGTEMPVQTDMLSRPLWTQAGMGLIGTKEAPGPADNPVIIEWAHELGGEIAADYKHDATPWCSLFLNLIFARAGLKGTNTLWALDWDGDAMQKRTGKRWPGVRLSGFAVGGVCPMVRDGGGHVINLIGRDRAGNIVGLGANQSDAVNLRSFPAARLNHGCWWPTSVPMPRLLGLKNLPIILANGTISTAEA